MALIPFAIHKETGAIQEIGEVPRGRKCGCICPSCKAGLVARRPKDKEWHFAHDPNAEIQPDKKCDISFESACRLFIIDLLKSGLVSVITTPAVPGSSRGPKRLEGIKFVGSGEYGDVKSDVDGYALEIFMDYAARARPELPSKVESTGVLSFPVSAVRTRYSSIRGGAQVLAKIVSEIFAEKTGGKRWLYHPLMRKAGAPTPSKNAIVEPFRSLSGEQQAKAVQATAGSDSLKIVRPSNNGAVKSYPHARTTRPEEKGTYRCYQCDYRWAGENSSSRKCDQCGSDRHSVFSPTKV